jgi:hypothetical protein
MLIRLLLKRIIFDETGAGRWVGFWAEVVFLRNDRVFRFTTNAAVHPKDVSSSPSFHPPFSSIHSLFFFIFD